MTTIKCCTKKRRQMALLCADAAGKYISHGQCTCRAGRAQSCCKNYKLWPLIIFNKNVMKNRTTVYSRYLRFYTVQLVSCSHFLKPFLPRGVLAALCTHYTTCTVLAECWYSNPGYRAHMLCVLSKELSHPLYTRSSNLLSFTNY